MENYRMLGVGELESQRFLLGRLLSEKVKHVGQITALRDVEFSVFSQMGDDGIIQWLIHHLDIPDETFIEFGVEDYRESNTRYLLMNDNWSGFIMDGSKENIDKVVAAPYFWKYDLIAEAHFIDKENINGLIQRSEFNPTVGLMHIDLDGNDFHIWKEINVIEPLIVIVEYNSVFGIERPISVPYDLKFIRTKAHFSNLYWGASLRALWVLAQEKGYVFIGCNSVGNNAYFVRCDCLNEHVREVNLENGFVMSKYRESRDRNGALTYLRGNDRANQIKDMPVLNVVTGKIEEF